MSQESFKIILPLPAKVLQPNCMIATIRGRFAKTAATRKYRVAACKAVEEVGVQSAPWGRCLVEADYYHAVNRKHDEDNAMGALKAAYDGIADAGIVKDDDWEHMMKGRPRFHVDKLCPRVVLTITRVDCPEEGVEWC